MASCWARCPRNGSSRRSRRHPASAEAQYATSRSSAKDVIEAAINNAEIRIFDANPDPNGSPIYNSAASEESNVKVAALREAFSGSPESGRRGLGLAGRGPGAQPRTALQRQIQPARANRLRWLPPDHAGTCAFHRHGSGPLAEAFQAERAPAQPIWRIVSSGNTLIDHAVGAGKTFTMIGAGQEQKRLGLIQATYVLNHMLEQFTREFLQAYPAAQVLVADKVSMTEG